MQKNKRGGQADMTRKNMILSMLTGVACGGLIVTQLWYPYLQNSVVAHVITVLSTMYLVTLFLANFCAKGGK